MAKTIFWHIFLPILCFLFPMLGVILFCMAGHIESYDKRIARIYLYSAIGGFILWCIKYFLF